VEITPESLRALLGKSSSFDKRQKAHLRKRIREAADESKKAVQAAALKPGETRGKSKHHRGLRAGIAKGTRVQILAGNRAGVAIVTRARLGAAWTSKRGWRHPTFGNREAWQQQVGNPGYFARTIWGKRNDTRRKVEQAMQDTLNEMGSR
jgi:hypothetical protein